MATTLCCELHGQRVALRGLASLPQRCPRSARAVARARKEDPPDDYLAEACPVPKDQQPIFELKQLQEEQLFKWAELPLPGFLLRLALVYIGFFCLIGIPVSAATFDFSKEPLQFVAAASIGSWFVVTVTLLRLYLGWSFVGNRLLSASVEYEETGWYDGQIWVKSPQVLMRDRLLSNYTVKPVIQRLKTSLVSSGAAAVLSSIILAAAPVNSELYQAPERNFSDNRLMWMYACCTTSLIGACRAMGRQSSEEEYWESVQAYEPWALEEDGVPSAASVLDHMMRS